MVNLIIADDEKIIRESILSFDWKKIGVNALACFASGEEVLEFLKNNSVDILLTDIRMSGMDGITLIAEVKKLYPGIAIICVSGYDEYEYLRSCLRLGAKDYLLKPIDRDKLFESVQTVISGKPIDEKDIFLNSPSIDEQQEQNHYIKIVTDYIEEHYAEPLSLETVAELVQLNPVYLSHLFKKIKKVKFSDYLNDVRLKNAMQLLKNTSLRINEVAFNVGYNDARYFATIFRKKTGMSPNEYRNK